MELSEIKNIESPNMKFPRLPEYAYIARFVVISAGIALVGCEHSESKQEVQTSPVAAVKPAPAVKPEPRKPLNLSLDKLAEGFVVAQTDDTEEGYRFITPPHKNERRIEFGGNLLTDENVEDYVDSIDGATLNITIKTR